MIRSKLAMLIPLLSELLFLLIFYHVIMRAAFGLMRRALFRMTRSLSCLLAQQWPANTSRKATTYAYFTRWAEYNASGVLVKLA